MALQEDFNKGTGAGWDNLQTWTTLSGTLSTTSNEAGGSTANQYGYVAAASFADGYVQAQWPNTDGRMAVIGRVQDVNNYYFALFMEPSPMKVRLFKFEGGAQTQLGSDGATTTQAGDTIKLDMNGTTIRVLLNDVEEVSVTDSTFTSAGYAGIRLYEANARADNWEATDPSAGGGGGTPAEGPVALTIRGRLNAGF